MKLQKYHKKSKKDHKITSNCFKKKCFMFKYKNSFLGK